MKRHSRVRTASMPVDPEWYHNAVIYQLHVRSFCDSNADGVGDFPGLISRLDYLQELGVTAVWLLPFYPSPLKDDGYDIAHYTEVNPSYGTIDDVRHFIDEAHRRRIRVITELVINHTSDQHPWFQRARRARKGSAEREFYVWSDTPAKYAGVRIIFKDYERSNWAWDEVAGQYYWHRFFSHQPDLNFDNPRVHEAVLRVCDYWLESGVDGLRLDAVPYLVEREGTSCENLKETHDFLRKIRAHVDGKFPGRMLLAEANQWPEDAVEYFGKGAGDECHMAFHFPLMPRLFMAIRMEERHPIVDILEQTPEIPTNAQWAMFLRNHDELTLEMVTDEERDYMWRVYASDPAARINLGIRRRLAPLLDNDRRRIELMNVLLFSMPGSPVIYYGDEIGMGDNIFLGDRNGVRTPMQWNPDRNAGFSKANPQRLLLPLIIDPEYHYETVNVEAQSTNRSSLLWWMKRLIAVRRRFQVLGRGQIRFISASNPKVLAFTRSDERDVLLVVANLSRNPQPVELEMGELAGREVVEMFGGVKFPAIPAKGAHSLVLGPYGFFWFALQPAKSEQMAATHVVPEVRLNASGVDLLGSDDLHAALEAQLPSVLPRQRWFVAKARTVSSVRVVEHWPIRPGSQSLRSIVLCSVEFTDGEAESYALPLIATVVETSEPLVDPTLLLEMVDGEGRRWAIRDGMSDAEFARELARMAIRSRMVAGRRSRLVGRRITRGRDVLDVASLPVKLSKREQSNTNIVLGERAIFKLFRKVAEGVNPELEMGEHLSARVGFANTAPLLAGIEVAGTGARRTLAVLMGYVAHEEDAWATFLDHGQRFYEGLDALSAEAMAALIAPPDKALVSGSPPPEAIVNQIAEPLEMVRLLARRTAEMHAALAEDQGDEAFRPEAYTLAYQRSLLQSMRNSMRATLQALRAARTGEAGRQVLSREPEIMSLFRRLVAHPIHALRIRTHGDYHLGQVLWTGQDFIIIDFEGEPLRSIGERRIKRSPLRDAAGMIRSFDYASWTSLRKHWELLPPEVNPAARERGLAGRRIWSGWLSREYARAYMETLRTLSPALAPGDDAELVLLTWLMEKALYEIRYELNSRPDWVDIPLRAVLEILDNTGTEVKG